MKHELVGRRTHPFLWSLIRPQWLRDMNLGLDERYLCRSLRRLRLRRIFFAASGSIEPWETAGRKNKSVSSSFSGMVRLPTRYSRRGLTVGVGFGPPGMSLGDETLDTGEASRGAADTVVTDVERRLRAKVRIARESESFETMVV